MNFVDDSGRDGGWVPRVFDTSQWFQIDMQNPYRFQFLTFYDSCHYYVEALIFFPSRLMFNQIY